MAHDNLKKIKPTRIDGLGHSGKLVAIDEFGHGGATDTIKGTIKISGDFLPAVSGGFDLGSASAPFKEIYVSSGTINIGQWIAAISGAAEFPQDGISLGSARRVQGGVVSRALSIAAVGAGAAVWGGMQFNPPNATGAGGTPLEPFYMVPTVPAPTPNNPFPHPVLEIFASSTGISRTLATILKENAKVGLSDSYVTGAVTFCNFREWGAGNARVIEPYLDSSNIYISYHGEPDYLSGKVSINAPLRDAGVDVHGFSGAKAVAGVLNISGTTGVGMQQVILRAPESLGGGPEDWLELPGYVVINEASEVTGHLYATSDSTIGEIKVGGYGNTSGAHAGSDYFSHVSLGFYTNDVYPAGGFTSATEGDGAFWVGGYGGQFSMPGLAGKPCLWVEDGGASRNKYLLGQELDIHRRGIGINMKPTDVHPYHTMTSTPMAPTSERGVLNISGTSGSGMQAVVLTSPPDRSQGGDATQNPRYMVINHQAHTGLHPGVGTFMPSRQLTGIFEACSMLEYGVASASFDRDGGSGAGLVVGATSFSDLTFCTDNMARGGFRHSGDFWVGGSYTNPVLFVTHGRDGGYLDSDKKNHVGINVDTYLMETGVVPVGILNISGGTTSDGDEQGVSVFGPAVDRGGSISGYPSYWTTNTTDNITGNFSTDDRSASLGSSKHLCLWAGSHAGGFNAYGWTADKIEFYTSGELRGYFEGSGGFFSTSGITASEDITASGDVIAREKLHVMGATTGDLMTNLVRWEASTNEYQVTTGIQDWTMKRAFVTGIGTSTASTNVVRWNASTDELEVTSAYPSAGGGGGGNNQQSGPMTSHINNFTIGTGADSWWHYGAHTGASEVITGTLPQVSGALMGKEYVFEMRESGNSSYVQLFTDSVLNVIYWPSQATGHTGIYSSPGARWDCLILVCDGIDGYRIKGAHNISNWMYGIGPLG